MIVGLGQPRPPRDPFRDQPTEPPPDSPDPRWNQDDGDYLYTAQVIAGLIATHYESNMGLGRNQAIRMSDAQIRPDQKFYLVEFEQAGKILAARSPTTETAQNWYELMKLYMSHRIVSIPVCAYGEEIDEVTRQCIIKIAQPREPEPDPKPLLSEKTSSLILPVSIVVIVSVLMLGGKK